MPPCPPLNPSPPKCPLVPRLNPKGLSNIWNRETSQHMPPCPPLNPSPPKSPLVPRLNPKGLSNIWNRETSQHMPPKSPCPPLNPSPPKSPLVPRLNPKGLSNIWNRETSQHMPPCPPLNPSPAKCPLVPRLNPKGLSNIWNRETSQHMPPCPPLNPSPPKSPLVPRLNPKGLSNIWNRETSQHMPPCPPLNPSPPKSPLVPRLNPKGLSNIWNRETSQHMPPCPPLNPSPPKSPLVPRLNPKGLSNIFKLLLFRGECDPLLGANVTPVPRWIHSPLSRRVVACGNTQRCTLGEVKPWSYVFTSICAIIGGAFSVATLVWTWEPSIKTWGWKTCLGVSWIWIRLVLISFNAFTRKEKERHSLGYCRVAWAATVGRTLPPLHRRLRWRSAAWWVACDAHQAELVAEIEWSRKRCAGACCSSWIWWCKMIWRFPKIGVPPNHPV